MNSLRDRIGSSTRTGKIDFVIETRNSDHVISRMPVTPGILNPIGRIQAGAMMWLADVTASILALEAQAIDSDGTGFPLAIDLHANLIGNQKDGEIQAEARFVHQGRQIIVVRTRITGTGDRLLAEVTSTHTRAR